MAPYEIRVIGDPVLKQRADDITDIDGKLARLVDDMIATMYAAPGVGLAAPQVGVQSGCSCGTSTMAPVPTPS